MRAIFQTTFLALLVTVLFTACVGNNNATVDTTTPPDYQLSLAQWSLHRSFFGDIGNDWAWFGRMLQTSPDSLLRGELDPMDFPQIAAERYDIHTIELVNTFYFSKSTDMDYWQRFKAKCDSFGVQVGLIMCDALGDLGDADEAARQQTVKNHHAWVDIANMLGAHSIRVNAAGTGTPEEVAANAANGLKELAAYAATKNIQVIVENHGGYSSNGKWLAGVMQAVNRDNVGTLPDFGNFCITRSSEGCTEAYDRYQGMTELMPYAKGVSAKSHDFDADGNEIHTDFQRMIGIVKDAGFKGFIGIEYEGSELSEDEGIRKTIALLKRVLE
ncbi:MAG: sugar phosphate isomerase/epimerase family protein [Saprospiraceae bacterium]